MIIYEKYKDRGPIHWIDYNERAGYREWVDWIVSLFPKGKDCNLLDIGCGDGLWTRQLTKRGFTVTGFDSSEYGINLAKKRNSKETELFLAETNFVARFGTDSSSFNFDYCLATEIIEHIPDPMDIVKIFDKCVRNYMILTTVDVEKSKHLGNKYHYKEYKEKEIREMFDVFDVERINNPDISGEFNTGGTMVLKIKK